MTTISKVVSGAQTGADRGGLDAAIDYGIPHSGWCPKGRRAEDGVVPAKYILKETASSGYSKRTELNILTSSATVVFTHGKAKAGSGKTLGFSRTVGKPHLHIDVSVYGVNGAIGRLVGWLKELDKEGIVLNVAGNRESISPGIQAETRDVLLATLASLDGASIGSHCGKVEERSA